MGELISNIDGNFQRIFPNKYEVTLLNICQFLGDMMNEFRHIGKNPAKL
jgi:uncharacterized protein (DUF2225 family)